MKYLKYTAWITFVLAVVVVTFATKLKQCKSEPNQKTTYETVKIETNKAIAIADTSTPVVDSVKLQKRQDFKRRVATAKVDR